jgi:hypothetical protein
MGVTSTCGVLKRMPLEHRAPAQALDDKPQTSALPGPTNSVVANGFNMARA